MKQPNMVLRGRRSIRQYGNLVVFVCLFLAKNRHVERADQHLFVEGVETQTWVSTLVDDVDLAKKLRTILINNYSRFGVFGAGSGCGNPEIINLNCS